MAMLDTRDPGTTDDRRADHWPEMEGEYRGLGGYPRQRAANDLDFAAGDFGGGRTGGRQGGGRSASALAQGLGLFSLGLGLAQLAMPEAAARLVGRPGDGRDRQVMMALGLRELASGIGILATDRPEGWLWARVGGDAMDLALLGGAYTSDGNRDPNRTMGAAAAVVGVLALDLYCARAMSRRG